MEQLHKSRHSTRISRCDIIVTIIILAQEIDNPEIGKPIGTDGIDALAEP